jgi:hypothetical protein
VLRDIKAGLEAILQLHSYCGLRVDPVPGFTLCLAQSFYGFYFLQVSRHVLSSFGYLSGQSISSRQVK